MRLIIIPQIFFSLFLSARCGSLEEDNGTEVRESKITDIDIENMGKQGLLMDDDDEEDYEQTATTITHYQTIIIAFI